MTISVDAFIAEVEAGISKAGELADPGDKCLMSLGDSMVWDSGGNQGDSVTLVVPAGDDFHVQTLNIYLSSRRVDNSDPNSTASDLTFRPAMWVTTDNMLDNFSNFEVQDANATWMLSDTHNGSYQGETGLSIACAYGARYGQGTVGGEVPLTAWPGRRRFFTPRKLKRGSSATIAIKPTFSRIETGSIKTQFRATVVLTGYKYVRRSV